MKRFDRLTIAKSYECLASALEVKIDEEVYSDYILGRLPTLLSYDKMLDEKSRIPAIQRYLISVKSALNQPVRFYDIYRNARFATLFVLIADAIAEGDITSCAGWENIRDKLNRTTDLEVLDSSFFEVLVAAYYRRLGYSVDFIPARGGEKSPDLKVYRPGEEFFAECKRYNRIKQSSLDFRDEFRNLFQKLKFLLVKGVWVIVHLDFKTKTSELDLSILFEHLINCISKRISFENSDYKIMPKFRNAQPLSEYLLYPSPKFDREMSGFLFNHHHGHYWIGMARYADFKAFSGFSGMTSWMDEISSSIGLNYRLLNREELRESANIGASKIFEGLNQISSVCANNQSNLHIWIETDLPNGSRKDAIRDFWEKRIKGNSRDSFKQIIVSETILNISYEGDYRISEGKSLMTKENWRLEKSKGIIVPVGEAFTCPF